MLARRFAMAFGLFSALAASQLPEYTQQYRQRLGGAIDELQDRIAAFDAEAGRLLLDRSAGIARLRANPDELARQRGIDVETMVEREQRLEHQRLAFSLAGPVSQYWVLASDLDSRLASQAYADFQPAVPVTSAGFLAGLAGLCAGWGLTHVAALPLRRRRRAPVAAGTVKA